MKHAANRRRGVSTRAFVALLALVLVIGCVAGGTIAWLISTPAPVVNTFTYGDINITLTETAGEQVSDNENNRSFKIIPGMDISKDPKVTIEAGSEACWLFVKVIRENWPTEGYLTYGPATGWSEGDGKEIPANVYYRQVSASEAKTGAGYYVLAGTAEGVNPAYPNGVIHVGDTLTKEMVNAAIKDQKYPQLIFTAYAVQSESVANAETAWTIANPANP